MASIIAYKGDSHAAPILIDSLRKMEYRGYDSVGIATITGGKILVRKGVGKVVEVNKSLDLGEMQGHIGIGHTRWATHGGVTDNNAHPHSACTNEIAVVHNGIIENYDELKQELIIRGHVFKSQTDSEVIAHLLEVHYSNELDIKKAMIKTCETLKGTYAFVAIFKDGAISGARLDEPLIVGLLDNEYFISSDILGFLRHTDTAIFLDNKDIVVIEDKNLDLFDFEGNSVKRPVTQVAWELAAAEKGAYGHYTLKEIHQQSSTIADALTNNDNDTLQKFCQILANAKNIYITGSGTSYHSALVLKLMLGKYAKIRSETIMSSEFEYTLGPLDANSAVIAISQSGETHDVLDSVKSSKQIGAKVLSIVNVPTSSLARISDCSLAINCGPEIGVAATKSFTGQLSVIYTIIEKLCSGCIGIPLNKAELLMAIREVLSIENDISKIVDVLQDINDIYILGRSMHYPIALEGALKIKEIAYIHAEGIAAGELKHGPLALVDRNTVMIVINPGNTTFNDTLSSVHEIKARGATVIGISDKDNQIYDHLIKIPHVSDVLYPIIEVIPLQIVAYHLAMKKNVAADYPQNLSKDVTIETKRGNLSQRRMSSVGTRRHPSKSDLEYDTSKEILKHNASEHNFERYPYAVFADKVFLDKILPLEIIIKAARPASSSEPIRLISTNGNDEVPVYIIVRPSEGFDIVDGKYSDIVNVPIEAKDSQPAIFPLRAIKEGSFVIKIDFFQERTYVGELKINTKVISDNEPNTIVSQNQLIQPPSKLIWNITEVPPSPDITLQIIEKGKSKNGLEYEIFLFSKDQPYSIRYGPLMVPLHVEEEFSRIFMDIERDQLTGNAIDIRMRSKGLVLYDRVFPAELKKTYWKIRDRIQSIQILSDEPWIPWEIIKPIEDRDDNGTREDEFLCERYSFSRWILGKMPFRKKERVKVVKVVTATNPDSVKNLEFDYIQELSNSMSLHLEYVSTYTNLMYILRSGNFDLLHISTHGEYDRKNPSYSSIHLEDGEFRPDDIYRIKFGSSNPLIVLNACKSGRQGSAFSQIQGWVTTFLEAGANSVIGTLWSVSEDTAINFTRELYNQLSIGTSLGEAVRKARINSKRSGDPSWLAYTLYGHPNEQIKLGS